MDKSEPPAVNRYREGVRFFVYISFPILCNVEN